MIYQPKMQPPAPFSAPQRSDDPLAQALGDRAKLRDIKQRMSASYPPPQVPQKKVFSSRPDSVDL